MPVETGAIPYYDPLRMDRDARLMLDSLAHDVRTQGVECVAAVRHGFVPDVVADIVKNSGAGRLILGTHGRRGLKKFVLGSVARQLLETVDVPVCTVGPRAHKRTPDSPGTILHPVSLAGMHENSAALSIGLGQQFQAQVLLLHVITPVARGRQRSRRSRRRRNRPAGEAGSQAGARPGRACRPKSPPAASSRRFSPRPRKCQAGLIVLGVHAPAHSWLPGTEPAAYKILVSAPCPVISLRVSPALVEEKLSHKELASPLAIG
jgi:hypothetical protein